MKFHGFSGFPNVSWENWEWISSTPLSYVRAYLRWWVAALGVTVISEDKDAARRHGLGRQAVLGALGDVRLFLTLAIDEERPRKARRASQQYTF